MDLLRSVAVMLTAACALSACAAAPSDPTRGARPAPAAPVMVEPSQIFNDTQSP